MKALSDGEMEARFAAYGRRVLEAHRDEYGDIDGGWLQDTAIECGLLVEVPVDEPCGEVCNCREYGDFPQKCLRIARERGEGEAK